MNPFCHALSSDHGMVTNHLPYENLFSESQVVPCGWTDGRIDRHDDANSHFSQYYELAYNTKTQ